MAEKIDLNRQAHKTRQRQVQSYGTQTPLSSTAVERGSTRWLNGSRVDIDGVLDVTGTATVSGSLGVSGTTTLSGSTTIAGPTGITGALTIAGSMDVTGPSTFSGTLGIDGATTITGQLDVTGPTTLAGTLDITGDTSITGTLSIEGDTTLTGDMDVVGGGKINIGTNMTLEPNTDGGAIAFQDGAKVSSIGGTVSVSGAGGLSSFVAGLTSAGLSSGSARYLAFDDGTWDLGGPSSGIASTADGGFLATSATDATIDAKLINLNAPQTSVNGKLIVTNDSTFTGRADLNGATWLNSVQIMMPAIPTIASPPNLYASGSGRIYKSTWSPV